MKKVIEVKKWTEILIVFVTIQIYICWNTVDQYDKNRVQNIQEKLVRNK